VTPNQEKDRLVSAVLTTADRFGAGDGACGSVVEPGLAGRTAYTLRVQTGCDESCAYCIIPSTRGRGRSRPMSAILAEVDRVTGAGFREVALTGVHMGSYGRDLGDGTTLSGLLQRLDEHRGDVRYRLSSLEPMDCTGEVVDLVVGSPRFAPHVHLPLQHASDRVLRRMRRPYGLAFYRELVDRVRRLMPHAAIGSDVVVGFPGETEDEVDDLVDYLEGSPLTSLHVFPYSDRPGTEAVALPDKVAGSAIRDRARRVREVGSRLSRRFRQSQVATVRTGLAIDDGSRVVTDNYLKVSIPAGARRNDWVDVRITAMGEPMRGEIVGHE
jgi:threonylcarbamoyladenosine tRNA methylthiotransferase MtaB